MMIAALLAAAAFDCSSPAAVQAAFTPAVEAYQAKDRAKAKALTDEIIAACGSSRLADFPRTMRADLASQEGDFDGVLRALGDTPRPAPPPLGSLPNYLAMKAYAGKKDAEGYARERARLVEASVARRSVLFELTGQD